jgi:hypothetical protein
LDLYIKFIIGVINACAAVILTFAIFKIPVRSNDKQMALIGLALGATNFYLKFVLQSNVASIVQVLVFIIVLTIVRRYPVLYSTAICVIGSVAYSIVDGVITYIAIKLNYTSITDAVNDITDFVVLHIVVTILYIVIAIVLVKYKFGFSFVRRRFSGIYSLGTATFVWAALLTLAVATIEGIAQNFEFLSSNSYMLIPAILFLLASIVYAYHQNKKSLVDRFGEKKKVG